MLFGGTHIDSGLLSMYCNIGGREPVGKTCKEGRQAAAAHDCARHLRLQMAGVALTMFDKPPMRIAAKATAPPMNLMGCLPTRPACPRQNAERRWPTHELIEPADAPRSWGQSDATLLGESAKARRSN